MAEQPKYIELRPKTFNPDQILIYLDKVDKIKLKIYKDKLRKFLNKKK